MNERFKRDEGTSKTRAQQMTPITKKLPTLLLALLGFTFTATVAPGQATTQPTRGRPNAERPNPERPGAGARPTPAQPPGGGGGGGGQGFGGMTQEERAEWDAFTN